jgi:hypothetical protein
MNVMFESYFGFRRGVMQLNKEVVVKKQILFLNNKRKSYESMFFMG